MQRRVTANRHRPDVSTVGLNNTDTKRDGKQKKRHKGGVGVRWKRTSDHGQERTARHADTRTHTRTAPTGRKDGDRRRPSVVTADIGVGAEWVIWLSQG